jgi:hypothetical protein
LTLNNFETFRPSTKRTLIDEEYLIPYTILDSINKDSQIFKFNVYPNYSSHITLFDDSTELLIPFDNGGGYLLIPNLFQLNSDTLRISSWTIYPNCYTDTTKITTYYWKVDYKGGLSEDIGPLYKKKIKIKKIKKKCNNKPPSELRIFVNNTSYTIRLNSPKDLVITTEIGCGYPDYNPSWDTNPPSKKVLRHSRQTKYMKTINVLKLEIKNGA